MVFWKLVEITETQNTIWHRSPTYSIQHGLSKYSCPLGTLRRHHGSHCEITCSSVLQRAVKFQMGTWLPSIKATFLTSFAGAYGIILANEPWTGEADDCRMVPIFLVCFDCTGWAQKPCYTHRQSLTIPIIVDDRIPSQMGPGKPQSGGSASELCHICVDQKPVPMCLHLCFI